MAMTRQRSIKIRVDDTALDIALKKAEQLVELLKESSTITRLEPLYTTEQVAKRMHCSEVTVARWVKAGRLSAINLGGNRTGPYVFRREDLEDFEQKSKVGKTKEVI